jgi:hypothetical protein
MPTVTSPAHSVMSPDYDNGEDDDNWQNDGKKRKIIY